MGLNAMTPKPSSSLIDLRRRAVLTGGVGFVLASCSPSDNEPADNKSSAPGDPQASASPERIVTLLGDSITAGYGLPSSQALPVKLEEALEAAGLAVRVRGAGVSGDTTGGGLARLDHSVQDDTDLCIVALGGNDMLQGVEPAVVRANLQAIISGLKARGIPVLLAGMRAPAQYGSYAAEFDRVFTDLARQDDIPAYPFLLEGVALDRRYNQPDGIHPNAEGVRIIAAGLAPVVAEALSTTKPG
ncbi:arylesterase [Brevundimonas sp.]|jgi:acyl-CoA thioesterase-1|uniref:arylesterase n=1 Tax=Brevundimonas sp. TaxID=1871086 RepID=UPI0037C14A23